MASIYKVYSTSKALLYVGCSLDIITRINSHKATKLWWPEISLIEIENIDDKKEAFKKEQQLIKELNPIYNNRHLEKFLVNERNNNYKSYLLNKFTESWSRLTTRERNIYYTALCDLIQQGLIEIKSIHYKQNYRLTELAIQTLTKGKLKADSE